jgi:hypothetical protein
MDSKVVGGSMGSFLALLGIPASVTATYSERWQSPRPGSLDLGRAISPAWLFRMQANFGPFSDYGMTATEPAPSPAGKGDPETSVRAPFSPMP